MLQSRQAWIIFAIVAGIIGLVAQTPAHAAPARVKVVDISGPSPFAPDGCGVDITQLGSEYEPDLAANPRDQRNIVTIWSQDKQISNVVATTHDGGEHWTQVLVPGLSKCTGGTADSALDARVSFGSDGTAYLSSQVVDSRGGRLFWTVLVNRSMDGGLSWSDPVTVDRAGPYPLLALDFPVLVADPRRPGTAYLVWSQFHDLFTAPAAPQFFSRTTDSGVTWTPPSMIPITLLPNQTAFVSQVRVLADGALVNVFIQIPVDVDPVGPTSVWAMRSTDQGDSWSAPIFVADVPENVVTDPDSGLGLGRGGSFVTPSVATGRGNEVYVAWHQIESTVSSRILLTKSADGGVTWSVPAAVATEATQAFKPTVAISAAGVVGVTYYDFRGDVSGDQQLTTDVWFRHSRDGGGTWSETHVAGPFDIRPAPSPGAFPLGDYFGLAPIANDAFRAIFVQTISPQTEGITDAFFARIQVPPAPQADDGSGCTLRRGHTNRGHLFAWLVLPVLMLRWARRNTHWRLSARPLATTLACGVLCATSAPEARAGINVWTSHGPDAPVFALAIDPNTPGTLYAATGFGGIFKSTDGGNNWGTVNAGLTGADVIALAIDPTMPSTLYAGRGSYKGHGNPGVSKSTDGGGSWSDTPLAAQAFAPARKVTTREDGIDLANSKRNATLAGARLGIGSLPSFAVLGIVVDPVRSSTLYAAAILGGVLKSTDGGANWSAVNSGLGSPDVIPSVGALVIDPVTPGTVYAATIFRGGVFKSTDDASSWVAAGLDGTTIGELAIDPVVPSTLYAASNTEVFKSTDGAGSWDAITVDPSSTSIRALVVDPNTPSTLYAGTDSGVFKSTDGASSWHVMNTGLSNTNVYTLAIDPFIPSTVYAGIGGVFSIQQIAVSPCVGDCNDTSTVTIDDLLMLVDIALGGSPISACVAGDRNQDNDISVDEILAAVNNALDTCPVPSTPTPSATLTITATGTKAPTPTPTPAVLAAARVAHPAST